MKLQEEGLSVVTIACNQIKRRSNIRDLFISCELDWLALDTVSVNNDYVAVLGRKGYVVCLRLPYLLCESKFTVLDSGPEYGERITDILLLPDSDRIVVSSSFDKMKLFDIHSHRLIDELSMPRYVAISDYFTYFVRKGRFGRYIASCSPVFGLCVIDMKKFCVCNVIKKPDVVFGSVIISDTGTAFKSVVFLDEKTLLFTSRSNRSHRSTIVWDFVSNRSANVNLLPKYSDGMKIVDAGRSICCVIKPSAVVKFRLVKDCCFVEYGAFRMDDYIHIGGGHSRRVDCYLIWYHTIDDYDLALYRNETSNLYYFVALDKETCRFIDGVSFLHPRIESVHLTPDECTLVMVSTDYEKFSIGAIDVRRLIEYVIS
jgi:hypothetical protein